MDSLEAQHVIESLRKGLPPDGYVRHFTIGRKAEIDRLVSQLEDGDQGVLLLKANWGSGKSHLLRFIREIALQEGYAVSSVTLDSKSAVRFNRMDQILGAICRGLEIPNLPGQKGISPFFNLVCNCIKEDTKRKRKNSFWRQLTNNYQWDYSDALSSSGLFIALRAWYFGEPKLRIFIEDWLYQPWVYKSQRKLLYTELVGNLRRNFRDPRADWQFYADDVFIFNTNGYYQSWATLRDFYKLTKYTGLKGYIILFDEFEDVIHNMNNIAHQQSAFWNLFQFYSGNQFQGMTYYAVTPDFAEKCKSLLISKYIWDYDFERFDDLETFEMSPLNEKELFELAKKIMKTHTIAYDWKPDQVILSLELKTLVKKAASISVQDRVRHTIREIVKFLDQTLEDTYE
jgi:hypothetical protein